MDNHGQTPPPQKKYDRLRTQVIAFLAKPAFDKRAPKNPYIDKLQEKIRTRLLISQDQAISIGDFLSYIGQPLILQAQGQVHYEGHSLMQQQHDRDVAYYNNTLATLKDIAKKETMPLASRLEVEGALKDRLLIFADVALLFDEQSKSFGRSLATMRTQTDDDFRGGRNRLKLAIAGDLALLEQTREFMDAMDKLRATNMHRAGKSEEEIAEKIGHSLIDSNRASAMARFNACARKTANVAQLLRNIQEDYLSMVLIHGLGIDPRPGLGSLGH